MKKLLLLIVIIAVLVPILLRDKSNTACFEDGFCVELEVKDTNEERALGLMFREELDENQGMLFVFDNPDRYSFWMKNMKISIDIIFLNENKEIIHIAKNVPPCLKEPCSLYAPNDSALYAIEVMAGFSEIHNLETGQEIKFTV